jgi:hypothetical protein
VVNSNGGGARLGCNALDNRRTKDEYKEALIMTSNELFRGLLAAIAVRKEDLPGDHSAMHKAFFEVLQEIRKPEVQDQLRIEDLFEIDFDPLYGQSGWFDKALTRAQRDQIVSFPNPSYAKIKITYDKSAGEAMLSKIGSSSTIQRLADIFIHELEPSTTHS